MRLRIKHRDSSTPETHPSTKTSDDDRAAERERYDARALMASQDSISEPALVDSLYSRPYRIYEDAIRSIAQGHFLAMELGAGTGENSRVLHQNAGHVIFIDVSHASLLKLRDRYGVHASPVVADIARLPIRDSSIDLLVSAGALSYADPAAIRDEVSRVLRPGGDLVIVDSLNHNLLFRINRWTHYRRGHRTRSTLKRMPTIAALAALTADFGSVSWNFSGAFLPMTLAARRLIGRQAASRLDDWCEQRIGSGRLAFKVVVVARDYQRSS